MVRQQLGSGEACRAYLFEVSQCVLSSTKTRDDIQRLPVPKSPFAFDHSKCLFVHSIRSKIVFVLPEMYLPLAFTSGETKSQACLGGQIEYLVVRPLCAFLLRNRLSV